MYDPMKSLIDVNLTRLVRQVQIRIQEVFRPEMKTEQFVDILTKELFLSQIIFVSIRIYLSSIAPS